MIIRREDNGPLDLVENTILVLVSYGMAGSIQRFNGFVLLDLDDAELARRREAFYNSLNAHDQEIFRQRAAAGFSVDCFGVHFAADEALRGGKP
jgi:hypothetical protein